MIHNLFTKQNTTAHRDSKGRHTIWEKNMSYIFPFRIFRSYPRPQSGPGWPAASTRHPWAARFSMMWPSMAFSSKKVCSVNRQQQLKSSLLITFLAHIPTQTRIQNLPCIFLEKSVPLNILGGSVTSMGGHETLHRIPSFCYGHVPRRKEGRVLFRRGKDSAACFSSYGHRIHISFILDYY